MKSLPMYFPERFDLQLANTCIQLNICAYDMYHQWVAQGKPRKTAKFHWQPQAQLAENFECSAPIWSDLEWFGCIDRSEPFGFIVTSKQDGQRYLVFRGTETASDWAVDIDADQEDYGLGYGDAHHGFLKLYRSLEDEMLDVLDSLEDITQLIVTGHSLGCGLSTLAIPKLIEQYPNTQLTHYNFASPRVASIPFAEKYNNNGTLTFRVVNTCDLVPQLPSAVFGKALYQHLGTPINFTAQYGSIEENHDPAHYQYALEHTDNPMP
ncbi:lipase family protein [Candidatus Albibeggiatoa sp. nov. NOAA]|uniref:lipase family protein n=1 Tax=Candidatus Albibeggiatoa sp. nov. NOAA TaxID=3162724 RepID=UPI0032F53300|nr:lipase family protein [Thiotrichaceae bacterium]